MVGFCINHFRFSLLSGKRNNFERPPSNEIEIARVMVITYESSYMKHVKLRTCLPHNIYYSKNLNSRSYLSLTPALLFY